MTSTSRRALAGLALLLAIGATAAARSAPRRPAVTTLHQLHATTLDGKDRDLATYKGKVLLIVNTASECGFTPQYEGLEALAKRYADRGLVVLGFPSNDFGAQEPGTAEEIATFCKVRFGVTFPLFAKSVVKGDAAGPVFKFLAAAKGPPKWNFHKYLVGKDGKPIAAYPSDVAPDDPKLIAAIDAALAAR
jgi:glutathione peroxidase